jgi:hypothetical protein
MVQFDSKSSDYVNDEATFLFRYFLQLLIILTIVVNKRKDSKGMTEQKKAYGPVSVMQKLHNHANYLNM